MNRLEEWEQKRDRVLVMGVLNFTPDSFYDGGRYPNREAAIERALRMVEEGAEIIDVGGESSRPGAPPVPADEEMERVIPVIEGIHRESEVTISIDTAKKAVAAEGLAAGASIVNDISALRFDPEMAPLIATKQAFVVLMHMQGTPQTMQNNPSYTDVVSEVYSFLASRIEAAIAAGIPRQRVIIDPGIGFGKRLSDNLALLRNLSRFKSLDAPILVGLSRKSFLGELLDLPVEERLEGTIAANAITITNGAEIIRVHDIKEGKRTALVARALLNDES